MQVNSSIYNYLSSGLVPKKRNITHKSSELKEVYNNMVRYNKNSPLFLLSLSESKQSYMINIKEAALTLRDVADSFANKESEIYARKNLKSEDEASISGAFRSNDSKALPDELNIQINSLASEQVNTGNYLEALGHDFEPGDYSFIVDTINDSTRFNVPVAADDNNYDFQQRIANSINNRKLNIHASVITDGNASSIMLSSGETGKPATDDGLFFTLRNTNDDKDIVGILGLDNISNYPSDSEFMINGGLHSSSSNHISINKVIELDFHKTTDGPVAINFVPDTEAALAQVDMFVDAYNSLVDLSDSGDATGVGSRSLLKDISGIVNRHRRELETAGLSVGEDNRIVKDETLLVQSVQNGEFASLFGEISSFRDDVEMATTRLTLDPMAYVNKLMVTYPNTQNKVNSAYTQSMYSGLMYNNYA